MTHIVTHTTAVGVRKRHLDAREVDALTRPEAPVVVHRAHHLVPHDLLHIGAGMNVSQKVSRQ